MSESSTPPQLPHWFEPNQIDTVMVGFPDVYGRLMGKRLTYDYFVEQTLHGGTHACNYLLTVDLDMNPLPGFQLASWEQGYGDFHLDVDLATLRRATWNDGAALVLCNLYDDDHQPIEAAPRRVLQRQVEKLAESGFTAMMGSELEFYLFRETYEAIADKQFTLDQPSSQYLVDYHLLQPARDEDVMRRIRNELSAAGIVVEGSKGEWGCGQHELNLLFAEALEMADRHAIYKHAAKEIAAQEGRAITFMAKLATEQAGSSFHLHSSLWDRNGQGSRFRGDDGTPTDEFRWFLGGLLKYGREMTYFFAPTVNSYKRFQSESWAPTALVWAEDNRTTAYRVVGSGNGRRVENRSPGADANPYLAFAATLAAGMAGIEEKLDCGEAYRGNAYADAELPRLPKDLREAADLLEGSELARRAFGDAVVAFYVHTARSEAAAYAESVTDWERRRYFERI